MVKQRLLSFAMVLGLGLLLMISLLLSTIISYLNDRIAEWFPVVGGVIPELGILVSLLLLTLAFALIFKYLPDVRIAWQDVLLGALVTAALFTFGRILISLYLSRSGVSSAYGAAGSLAVILLFVYYSMQIILFGAEFTQVYANRFGSNLLPDKDAQIIIRKPATAQEPSTTAALHSPEPVVPTRPVNHSAQDTLQKPVRQREKEMAAGLIGLAVGLLFAFFAGRRR
jgi:membrane protein